MIGLRIFSLVMMTSQLRRTHHRRCENCGHQTSKTYLPNDMLFVWGFWLRQGHQLLHGGAEVSFLKTLFIHLIYIYCTSILPKFSFPKMKIGRFWVLTSMRPSRKSRRPAKLCGQVVTESWPSVWAALRRANVALRCEGVQETLVVVSSRQDIWLDQRGASNMRPICPACPACWLR